MLNDVDFSKSLKEHDEHLKETLYKLREANLTLNEEKCEFAKPSVEFLGTIINAESIQVGPKKVQAIAKIAALKDPSELRRLLEWLISWANFSPIQLSSRNC